MSFLLVSIESGTGTGPNLRTKVEGHTASRAALAWIVAAPQSLSQARKRDRVPLATVVPGSSDLKTGVFEKASNAPVRELVTVLGVNRFASLEVKIKLRELDTYILLLRTRGASRSGTPWDSKARDGGSNWCQRWPPVPYSADEGHSG